MGKRSPLHHSILFYPQKKYPDKALGKILNEYIGVFGTQSNVYDAAYLGKHLTTFSRLQNRSIADAQLGSEYRSENF